MAARRRAAEIGRLLALGAGVAVLALTLPVVAVLAVGVPLPTRVGGIPAVALAAYESAAATCPGLSWAVLAGIGEVESDHGRSTLPGVQSGANGAGAEGPMQMLPATFTAYAAPGHGDVYDVADAALAAARMRCADGGADPAGTAGAIWSYNHSPAYVQEVLAWAARYSAAGGHGADAGRAVAAWALTQVGKPYRWGAAGPDAYDCSGLVLRAWEAAGVELPRVAADQYRAGAHIPVADAQPGDLVFFAPDPADPATIEHIGISLGDGTMVEAPHTGADVRVVPIPLQGLVPLTTRPG